MQINDLQGRLQNLQQQMSQGPPGGWGPLGPPPGHPGYRPPMPGAIPPGLVPQQPTPLQVSESSIALESRSLPNKLKNKFEILVNHFENFDFWLIPF